jgi:hypothetical protein
MLLRQIFCFLIECFANARTDLNIYTCMHVGLSERFSGAQISEEGIRSEGMHQHTIMKILGHNSNYILSHPKF